VAPRRGDPRLVRRVTSEEQLVSKPKAKQDVFDTASGPVLSARFVVTIVLIVLGIAWIAYYYAVVRVDPTVSPAPKADGPAFMADLERWNYVIGFGAILLGLVISSHPSTPLGRGRGVVVGMLGCFLIGLLWICTFYVISNNSDGVPVFNDLGQYNLMVGIAFMAVGFTFATRWE
jgi:Cell division protein CrgA